MASYDDGKDRGKWRAVKKRLGHTTIRTRSYRMRKRNGNRLGASSQKKLHVHLVDEKAMDDEILTMVAELKLVHGMVLRFRLD